MATGSIDRTCKIWDVGSGLTFIFTGQVFQTLTGHIDEVLDVNFNSMGTKIVTASADRTARVYNVSTGNCSSVLHGSVFLIRPRSGDFTGNFQPSGHQNHDCECGQDCYHMEFGGFGGVTAGVGRA